MPKCVKIWNNIAILWVRSTIGNSETVVIYLNTKFVTVADMNKNIVLSEWLCWEGNQAWVYHLFVIWMFDFLFVCQLCESTLVNIWCGKQMHLSTTQCAFACLSPRLEKNSWILTELHDTHLKNSSSSNGEVTFSGWFHQALFV